MQVVFRNFVRLIAIGAFNADEQLEPMSDFKWRQTITMARANNVHGYICNGLLASSSKSGARISQELSQLAKDTATKTTTNDIPLYINDTDDKSRKIRFSSVILNHRYNRIVFNEIHNIDTSTETIALLDLLIANMSCIMSSGVSLQWLIKLGVYLRENGNRIDFVKAERWIKQLKMRRAVNQIASYLITLCGFSQDELPFLKKPVKNLYAKECAHFCDLYVNINFLKKVNKDEPDNETNINKIDTKAIKHMTMLPMESISRFFTSIGRSLANIEE